MHSIKIAFASHTNVNVDTANAIADKVAEADALGAKITDVNSKIWQDMAEIEESQERQNAVEGSPVLNWNYQETWSDDMNGKIGELLMDERNRKLVTVHFVFEETNI